VDVDERVEIPRAELRDLIDNAWFPLGLPDGWLRTALSDHLRVLQRCAAVEAMRRDGSWDLVERGGWPA
jgi:hypothetical protein